MQLKPIETLYNGRRFRSRAEARIAVFLDALGVAYQYEREGYDLGIIGSYLPDFDTQHGFIEVKGDAPTPFELLKAATLAQVSGRVVFVVSDSYCYMLSPVSFCEEYKLAEIAEELGGNALTIDDAIKAMRQARFEHGETPTILLKGEPVIPLKQTKEDADESPLVLQRRYMQERASQ